MSRPRLLPVRALELQPLLATALVGVLAVEIEARSGAGAGTLASHGRLAAIAVAGAASFLLHDAAAATVASAPVTLARRTAVRASVAAVLVFGASLVLGWRSGLFWSAAAPDHRDLVGRLALEVATYLALALGAAAWAARHGRAPGVVGAGVVLIAVLAALQLPEPWSPLPVSPLAPDAPRDLAVALAAGAGVAALQSRDPARRPALRP